MNTERQAIKVSGRLLDRVRKLAKKEGYQIQALIEQGIEMRLKQEKHNKPTTEEVRQ